MTENEKKPEDPVAAPPKPTALDWSAIRDGAFAKVATRVRALQNLEKVSKGRGTPSLNEQVEMFTAIATCLAALPREIQQRFDGLMTVLVNFSVRMDALVALMEEKGVLEKGALATKMTTIIDEQKALLKKQKEDALAKSVEQTKKGE